MNLNYLARLIAQLEGKKKATDIAQIKEVLSCLGEALRSVGPTEMVDAVNRIIKQPAPLKSKRRA